jgi:hypothetical protein
MAWVRDRDIPTERQPLVGEASANFSVREVSPSQRDGSLLPYSRISRPEFLDRSRYFFFQVAPQLYPQI